MDQMVAPVWLGPQILSSYLSYARASQWRTTKQRQLHTRHSSRSGCLGGQIFRLRHPIAPSFPETSSCQSTRSLIALWKRKVPIHKTKGRRSLRQSLSPLWTPREIGVYCEGIKCICAFGGKNHGVANRVCMSPLDDALGLVEEAPAPLEPSLPI
jgi:hypothetical protein